MLDWRLASAHFILTVTLMLWSSGKVLSADVATEVFDLRVTDVQSPPTAREEKSATDLAAKFLLLDEFVSLENDVIETKKKRSFSGFGSPLDRLSAGSVEHKGKQRKFKVLRRAKVFAQKFTQELEKLRMQLEYKDAILLVLHGVTTKESSRSSKTAIWYPCGSDWWEPALKFQRLIDSIRTLGCEMKLICPKLYKLSARARSKTQISGFLGQQSPQKTKGLQDVTSLG